MIPVRALAGSALLLAVAALTALAPRAAAQCLLVNPSFEIASSAGGVFAGWNEMGVVASASPGTHGAAAARFSGRDTGGWNLSGVWQILDTAPGATWEASACAWHTATNPLAGGTRAILNIEWRDATGVLLDFESHTVIDATAPLDQVVAFRVQSQPAPPGTARAHLLLGVLQDPSAPPADATFDQVTFEDLGPPSPEDRQWFDFGGGRTLDWSGYTWRVKGPGALEPGGHWYCDAPNCTWVDAGGRLHLTVQHLSGALNCTEVALDQPLGYGDYVFTTVGRLDAWDPNVVLGLFLWEYRACHDPADGWWGPNNEIDIEWSRWGDPARSPGQFVAQPFDWPGNIQRFDAAFADSEITSHAFRWRPDAVAFRSWRGGPLDEQPANLIAAWTYAGPHIPRPERPRAHINFWMVPGVLNAPEEVVLQSFTFVPDCAAPHCDSLPTDAPPVRVARDILEAAVPNPFNPSTTLRYRLAQAGPAQLVVYDVLGRRVRTLVHATQAAGEHAVVWDGRDDAGHRAASGVYLYRLHTPAGAVLGRRMVLLE